MEAITALQRQISQETTDEGLGTVLADLVRTFGFRYFSYIASKIPGEDLARRASPPLLTNYPQEWKGRYLGRDYHLVDPVVVDGARSRLPFRWGGPDYVRRLGVKPKRVFDEAGEFGINYGFSMPIYGPDGDCGIFSVASDDGAEFDDAIRESGGTLQVIANYTHAICIEKLLAKPPGDPIRLTAREKECLLWTARGKTSWEIAKIIARSTPTVNYHLQKSIRKLGAANKHQAAIMAYEQRLLD